MTSNAATNLINLQSALSLLTSAASSQISGKTSSGENSPSSGNSSNAITGAAAQPVLPAFYTFNESTSLSVKDGVVSGTFNENSIEPLSQDTYAEAFQTWMSENSMTDRQISDAVYSGGLQEEDTDGTQSLVSQIQNYVSLDVQYDSSDAAQINQWQASGRTTDAPSWLVGGVDPATATDDQVQATADFFANAVQEDVAIGQAIISAFNNHTLQIQNAVDVQGLNFTESSSSSWDGDAGSAAGNGSYDTNFVDNNPDGKQHYILPLGDATLYLSW